MMWNVLEGMDTVTASSSSVGAGVSASCVYSSSVSGRCEKTRTHRTKEWEVHVGDGKHNEELSGTFLPVAPEPKELKLKSETTNLNSISETETRTWFCLCMIYFICIWRYLNTRIHSVQSFPCNDTTQLYMLYNAALKKVSFTSVKLSSHSIVTNQNHNLFFRKCFRVRVLWLWIVF